jgi:hypothetical protein
MSSTRANLATSLIYIVAFGRRPVSSPFLSATIVSTYRLLAGAPEATRRKALTILYPRSVGLLSYLTYALPPACRQDASIFRRSLESSYT